MKLGVMTTFLKLAIEGHWLQMWSLSLFILLDFTLYMLHLTMNIKKNVESTTCIVKMLFPFLDANLTLMFFRVLQEVLKLLV